MKKTHAGSKGSSVDDDPVVEFQPNTSTPKGSPPTPVTAREYLQTAREESRHAPGDLVAGHIDEFLPAADASRLGWVLKCPSQLVTKKEDDGTLLLAEPGDQENGGIVEVVDAGDGLFCIDLQWNVRVPQGTSLYAYPVFNSVPEPDITVVPSAVAHRRSDEKGDEGRGFTAVKIYVRVSGRTRLPPGTAVAQLVLVKDVAPVVPTRTLTPEETEIVEKNMRAMEIYPDWYEEHRVSDR